MYGHDARDDGTVDANGSAVINKLLECRGLEEELSDDEVCPCIHLLLEVYKVVFVGVCVRMARGVACNTHCEVVLMVSLDVLHQVRGVVELVWVIAPLLVNVGQVSSQGQDVPQAHVLGLVQVAGDVLLAAAHTGHVQHGLHPHVLDSAVGDHHGTGLTVTRRIAGWVPGDV